MKPVRLRGLDGLRFVAAFAVIGHHVEQLKDLAGLPSRWSNPSVGVVGGEAVRLFFTLSGFLITYLLLDEHARAGRISMRGFLVRRALRILPLYYLVTAIGFGLLPFIAPTAAGTVVYARHTLPLYLALLPNVALMAYPRVVGASHLWSIGWEEQFYFLWPWVVIAVRDKTKLLWLIALSCVALLLAPALVRNEFLRAYLRACPYMFLLAGATAGTLLHQRAAFVDRLILPARAQWLVLPATMAVLLAPAETPLFNWVRALFYAYVLLNVARSSVERSFLESRPARYLGRISYGLYMYHPLLIQALIAAAAALRLGGVALQLWLYLGALASTIAVSTLSSRFFETPLQRLARRSVPAPALAQASARIGR